jgi:predicted small metal-binding protein
MGMNCDFEVKDKNREELVEIIAVHAQGTHNMKRPLPSDIMEKVNKEIKK